MRKATAAHRETLGLWDRVVLVLEKANKRSEFVSRIEDIKHDSYVLEMPLRQSGELHLYKGDAVEVIYSRRDAVYSFKASILDLFEGEDKTLRIEKTSDVTRTQRRKYVRLDISGEMLFRSLDLDNRDNIGPDMDGTLLNISAGGVLFESSVKLPEKRFITVSFTLKGRQALRDILAVVKRCEGSKAKGYLVGAEFITRHNSAEYDLEHIDEFLPPGAGTFDENLQKLVVQFIYNQQVELRKKGLLGR
jgi:c-di-GMP-binding flagellar brake protein YcgR